MVRGQAWRSPATFAVAAAPVAGYWVLLCAFPWWLSRVLGIERPVSRRLVLAARQRSSHFSYVARASAFALATSGVGRLMGRKARSSAIDALVYIMLRESEDTLVFLGLQTRLGDWDCAGLLEL